MQQTKLMRWAGLLAATTLLASTACSSGPASPAAGSGLEGQAVVPTTGFDQLAEPVRSDYGTLPLGAGLRVRNATWSDGGSARLVTRATREDDGRMRIEIAARDATRLRVLDVELDYDARHWHSDGGVASGVLNQADALSTVLQFTGEARPGALEHTQALAPLDTAQGFSGDGVLATLWLAPGPARSASAVAVELPRPQELSYNPVTQRLHWFYNLAGDYDQNGEVNSSDLVALARQYGEESPPSPGGALLGFPFTSIEAVADGDGNGAVGLSDLTVIGRYLGARVGAYELYGSADSADYFAQSAGHAANEGYLEGMTDKYVYYSVRMMASPAGNVDGALLRQAVPVDFGAFSDQQRGAGRLAFDLDYDNAAGDYLWLRSVNGGARSLASDPAGLPIDAPALGYPDEYDLRYEGGAWSWYPFLRGDYDGNSNVTVMDLQALPKHFNEPGPFDPGSWGYIVDCNFDQVIDIRDLRNVQNYLKTEVLSGNYALFRVDSAGEVPVNPLGAETAFPVIEHMHFDGQFPLDFSARPRASWIVASQPGWYYVRAELAAGYGPRSNAVQIP
jgi:hypothetical protein